MDLGRTKPFKNRLLLNFVDNNIYKKFIDFHYTTLFRIVLLLAIISIIVHMVDAIRVFTTEMPDRKFP